MTKMTRITIIQNIEKRIVRSLDFYPDNEDSGGEDGDKNDNVDEDEHHNNEGKDDGDDDDDVDEEGDSSPLR